MVSVTEKISQPVENVNKRWNKCAINTAVVYLKTIWAKNRYYHIENRPSICFNQIAVVKIF